MFSRIGRSAYRSARATLHKGAFSAIQTECSTRIGWGNGGLKFLRSYLTLIGGKYVFKSPKLKECDSFLKSRSFGRLFCSQSPEKKQYENYYPESKTANPKHKQEKSEKKEDSGASSDTEMPSVREILTILIVSAKTVSLVNGDMHNEISFQEFKNRLLEPGLVDHIVVSNKSVAKVYLKKSPSDATPTEGEASYDSYKRNRGYDFRFNIVSVEAFEEKLEEAQEALGIHPRDYVPVIYESKMRHL